MDNDLLDAEIRRAVASLPPVDPTATPLAQMAWFHEPESRRFSRLTSKLRLQVLVPAAGMLVLLTLVTGTPNPAAWGRQAGVTLFNTFPKGPNGTANTPTPAPSGTLLAPATDIQPPAPSALAAPATPTPTPIPPVTSPSGTHPTPIPVTPAPPPPPANLISNPSFEADMTGWIAWQARPSRVASASAPDGNYVAEVQYTTGSAYSLETRYPVTSTVAGTVYSASTYVAAASPSAVGKTVRLAVREWDQSGHEIAVSQSNPVPLSTSFQQLVMPSYTVHNSGDRIDVYVIQFSASTGDAMYADNFKLVRG